MVKPERVISDLRELAALTGGPGGARRLAWSETWREARSWLRRRLDEIDGLDVHVDAAGNLWATLPGSSADGGAVLVGSHIDSVPNGGWLDGALGVVAGLEMLRARAPGTDVTLRLVDWADEEGARFGRSLFGSTAATGRLVASELEVARDALAENGVDLDRANEAQGELAGARSYIELHIEQGPVLERRTQPVAVVDGCTGVERQVVELSGQAAHAGAAPMPMRRDPLVAAARAITQVVELAERAGATATIGQIVADPGVVTIVPGRVELTLDLRHPDRAALNEVFDHARAAFEHAADHGGVTVRWQPQWRIEPVRFDSSLVALGHAALEDVGVEPFVMTSGALHDAAAVAPFVPTVMLFVPSIGGISHSRVEDTREDDIAAGVRALDALLMRACGQSA